MARYPQRMHGDGYEVWPRARSGQWSARVRLPPTDDVKRWHYSKTYSFEADGLRDARRQAEELVRVLRAQPERHDVTLADYAKRYHETRKRLEPDLSQSTITREHADIEYRIVPNGDVPVSDVTPATVRGILDAIAANGGTPGNVWSCYSVMRRILRQAVADGLLRVNPCDDVTITRMVHEPTPDRSETLLSDDEAAKLIRAAMREPATGYTSAVVLAGTLGLRRGEALGLAWDDVDMEARRVAVAWQLTARKERKRPKSGSARVVVMPMTLAGYLEKLRDRQREVGTWRADGPVCCDKNGGWLSPTNFSRWRRRWYVAHGVGRFEGKHYVGPNLHSLRHDHVSRLLDAGLSLPAVAERVGHSRPTTTAAVYAHARVERAQDAADVIDGALS